MTVVEIGIKTLEPSNLIPVTGSNKTWIYRSDARTSLYISYCTSENAYSNRNLEDLELKILSDSSSCPGANKVRQLHILISSGDSVRLLVESDFKLAVQVQCCMVFQKVGISDQIVDKKVRT